MRQPFVRSALTVEGSMPIGPVCIRQVARWRRPHNWQMRRTGSGQYPDPTAHAVVDVAEIVEFATLRAIEHSGSNCELDLIMLAHPLRFRNEKLRLVAWHIDRCGCAILACI